MNLCRQTITLLVLYIWRNFFNSFKLYFSGIKKSQGNKSILRDCIYAFNIGSILSTQNIATSNGSNRGTSISSGGNSTQPVQSWFPDEMRCL